MRHLEDVPARALAVTVALACCVPAPAAASGTGGVSGPAAAAPSARLTGGSAFGVQARAGGRPVVGELVAPGSAPAGRPPQVSFRIDERGVGTVNVRVAVHDLSTGGAVVVIDMGWVHTGRLLSVAWPARTRLRPGTYHISLIARDHRGNALLRRAHSSGVTGLVVVAPPSASPPPRAAPPPAGVATPAQTAAAGAVFPVAGPHSLGGPENRFGAPRNGHVHQGQDILTEEGTPVVAPLAGVIVTSDYQAGGAGYYTVEHTGEDFDFMFAHCKAGSLALSAGQLVSAGQPLCAAGQTGDATAPHLHLEMWVGGWQAPGGYPIDPLPYLQAWERAGAPA